MFADDKVTEIFYLADDFYKFFESQTRKYTVEDVTKPKKCRYHRKSTMSMAEVMTIVILLHGSGYRSLKHYYLRHVCVHMRHMFPNLVSYNRFVELKRQVTIPMAIFIKKVLLGECTSISFVDSTPLRVCRNQLSMLT